MDIYEAGRELATLVEDAREHLGAERVDEAMRAWVVAVHDDRARLTRVADALADPDTRDRAQLETWAEAPRREHWSLEDHTRRAIVATLRAVAEGQRDGVSASRLKELIAEATGVRLRASDVYPHTAALVAPVLDEATRQDIAERVAARVERSRWTTMRDGGRPALTVDVVRCATLAVLEEVCGG